MNKTIKFSMFSVLFLAIAAITLSFTVPNRHIPSPVPAPSSTTISIIYTSALDYSDNITYPDHEIKVTFYGARYSDGQELTDPSSPFYGEEYYFCNPYFNCTNFYYCDGHAVVYTRPNSSASWTYQGDMIMSANNCSMDGSKVTMFTVDCRYIDNP